LTSNYVIYSIVIVDVGDTVDQEPHMQNRAIVYIHPEREPVAEIGSFSEEMPEGFSRMKDIYGDPPKIKRRETVSFLYPSSFEYKYYTNECGRTTGTKPIPINNK